MRSINLRGFFAVVMVTMSYSVVHAADKPKSNQPSYLVSWDKPGNDHRDSMPIGNGDVGANVWTNENGELVFLISKTDSWSENGQLDKIGQVRMRLSPNPFTDIHGFEQALDVRNGEIKISTREHLQILIWIDANHPVLHVEYASPNPISVEADIELWRNHVRSVYGSSEEARSALREISHGKDMITFDRDKVLPASSNMLRWVHSDERSVYPMVLENQHLYSLIDMHPDPLLHRVFGALVEGPGLVSKDDYTLASSQPGKSGRIDVFVTSEHPSDVDRWDADIRHEAGMVESIPIDKARTDHERWWNAFWGRSWINVSGSADADAVTQGYAMQRWMMAASGRGPMPVKFNGGIFTIGDISTDGMTMGSGDDPAKGRIDPDFRAWGSNYWFQNQRLLYWPLIASGDTDLVMPFVEMYRQALPLGVETNALYNHHAGARFPETIYFWGTPSNADFGWGNKTDVMTNNYIRYHIDGNVELVMMMLDMYDQTRDDAFARDTLLPIAKEVTAYFNQHWQRVNGKILFDPSQSLETDRPSVNPAPDVAGLHAVLPRLLKLPPNVTDDSQRSEWAQMLAALPDLPRGHTNVEGKHPEPQTNADPKGKEILWTADSWVPEPNGKPGNVENPELYAIFPYRLFGVELPELQMARDTFAARRFVAMTCWHQDGIQAADLGLTNDARRNVVANFTAYGVERFRWFWKKSNDWEPDLDNGGAGMTTLQHMLMQTRGDKILLLPSWPKDWNVDFKLHAPDRTTIEGSYKKGKLVSLHVDPPSRQKDVLLMQH